MTTKGFAALMAGAFLISAGPAFAGPWDGIYRQNKTSDCASVGHVGGSLEIREGVFYGQGLACRMTRPVDVLDMDATLYTMDCVDGNGEDAEHWSERVMMMRDAEGEGIIMVWNGYSFRYEACAVEVAPAS